MWWVLNSLFEVRLMRIGLVSLVILKVEGMMVEVILLIFGMCL